MCDYWGSKQASTYLEPNSEMCTMCMCAFVSVCRRRRTYSTALGVYQEQCGLRNVYMSWGAAEYLYMLLVLNQTQLPEEALSMLR